MTVELDGQVAWGTVSAPAHWKVGHAFFEASQSRSVRVGDRRRPGWARTFEVTERRRASAKTIPFEACHQREIAVSFWRAHGPRWSLKDLQGQRVSFAYRNALGSDRITKGAVRRASKHLRLSERLPQPFAGPAPSPAKTPCPFVHACLFSAVVTAYHRGVSRLRSHLNLTSEAASPLRVAGLFAGIGGIEVGLHRAGHETAFLCENDEAAGAVLKSRFRGVPIVADVRDVSAESIGTIDLLSGGFPCQDLSQAGRMRGIQGEKSGLVSHMFRILDELAAEGRSPRWLLIENVQNMLSLDRGEAMHFLISELTKRGMGWAYRVVDTQAFGLPQRRQRVILLASASEDPAAVLLTDDVGAPPPQDHRANHEGHGFYWTEGIRGLGWAPAGIPTLKGGSALGIPSPPAVWLPDGTFVTPGIGDAERLQGFDLDWTATEETPGRRSGPRWKMVGNAVSVPVAEWVGWRLRHPSSSCLWRRPFVPGPSQRWPAAAAGGEHEYFEYQASAWPVRITAPGIATFLRQPKPLSKKAACGFRERTFRAKLRLDEEPKATFLKQLDLYIEALDGDVMELRRIADEKRRRLESGLPLRSTSETAPGL